MAIWTAQEFLLAWEVKHSKLDAKWHDQFFADPMTIKILTHDSENIMRALNRKRLADILIDLEDNKARSERKPVGTYSERIEPTGPDVRPDPGFWHYDPGFWNDDYR